MALSPIEQAVERIVAVLDGLDHDDTGNVLTWLVMGFILKHPPAVREDICQSFTDYVSNTYRSFEHKVINGKRYPTH